MGSSVLHGGLSTFLAISVLAFSNSYIFEVFYKCWFCIIIAGMSNGFFLLPVILSYIGPTKNVIDEHHGDKVTPHFELVKPIQTSTKRE